MDIELTFSLCLIALGLKLLIVLLNFASEKQSRLLNTVSGSIFPLAAVIIWPAGLSIRTCAHNTSTVSCSTRSIFVIIILSEATICLTDSGFARRCSSPLTASKQLITKSTKKWCVRSGSISIEKRIDAGSASPVVSINNTIHLYFFVFISCKQIFQLFYQILSLIAAYTPSTQKPGSFFYTSDEPVIKSGLPIFVDNSHSIPEFLIVQYIC